MENWFFDAETSMITSEGTPVAVVFNGDKVDPYANARLIESAPSMYRLLDRISRELCETGDDENLRSEIDMVLGRVVAKALQPCPFCGGTANTALDDDEWSYVFCTECGARSDSYETEGQAIGAWDRRDDK